MDFPSDEQVFLSQNVQINLLQQWNDFRTTAGDIKRSEYFFNTFIFSWDEQIFIFIDNR